MYVPSGFPGASFIARQALMRYSTVFCSPAVAGARPSNSSDARIRMCLSRRSGVMDFQARGGTGPDSAPDSTNTAAPKVAINNRRDMGLYSHGLPRKSHQGWQVDCT